MSRAQRAAADVATSSTVSADDGRPPPLSSTDSVSTSSSEGPNAKVRVECIRLN